MGQVIQEKENCYPPFLSVKFEESEKRLERERNQEEVYSYNPTKITDFLPLIHCIWKLSSKPYQQEYWNKHGQWGDNYSETLETFLGDTEAVLDTSDYAVEMTPKQREMLQRLYDIVEEYDDDPDTPLSRYGENDQAIINDPKWQEIGKYAKLVYEELSGDDLDAWEKSRQK